jgi:hypothetical protein
MWRQTAKWSAPGGNVTANAYFGQSVAISQAEADYRGEVTVLVGAPGLAKASDLSRIQYVAPSQSVG